MKTYKNIFMVCLIVLLGLPSTSASAGAPQRRVRSASMTLTAPAPNPVLIGNEITFDLVFAITDVTPGVSGAEIYLSYNSALVTTPTTPGVAVAEALPDFFGTSNVSINEVLPAAQCPGGASPCVHLVLAGPPQTTQSGIAARFHFRAAAEGLACFSVLQSKMVDANGFQVDHLKGADPCVAVKVSATASGVALRQGVPAGGTLACSSVTTSGTAALGPVNTDVAGKFSVGNMPAGTYTFRVVYPGYLASEKAGVIVAANSLTVDVGTTTLRGGDVNADNAVNILDIGTIISKFGKTGFPVKSTSANCSGADEPTDINDDGAVTISDLAITAGNWGKTAPTSWTP